MTPGALRLVIVAVGGFVVGMLATSAPAAWLWARSQLACAAAARSHREAGQACQRNAEMLDTIAAVKICPDCAERLKAACETLDLC